MKIVTGVNPPLDELAHYGIKGMHWGVRRDRTTLSKDDRRQARKNIQALTKRSLDNKYADGNLFERPMSEAEYKKLSNKTETFRKGQTVQRVTTRKDEQSYPGITYVSTNKADRDIYRAVMPVVNGVTRFGGDKSYKKHYEVTFKALETLKSPSQKERVDAFSALMDQPSVKLKNGKTLTGREYMVKLGYRREVKTLNSQQLGLRFYKQFAEDQGNGMDSPLNSAYFNSLKEKGYNSVLDDNDRDNLAKTPLIVLNPNGSLKTMSVKPLSADDIVNAQLNLKTG